MPGEHPDSPVDKNGEYWMRAVVEASDRAAASNVHQFCTAGKAA